MIFFYKGLVSNIPVDWEICDGTGQTPNLIDNFIIAINDINDEDMVNGFENVVLNTSHLPLHSHTGTLNGEDDHIHSFDSQVNIPQTTGGVLTRDGATTTQFTFESNSAGAHTHSVQINSPEGSNGLINLEPDCAYFLPITPKDINDFVELPVGIIVNWSGVFDDISDGWVLCDGTNGTTDLSDRFVKFSNSDNGGLNGNSSPQVPVVPHTHSNILTSTDGEHTHQLLDRYGTADPNENSWEKSDGDVSIIKYTNYGGNHQHSGITNTVGTIETIDITPPYYKLAFLMYVGG